MKKSAKKIGSRHRLLFYRRMMDRVWQQTIWLFLVLLAIWWWPQILNLTTTQDTLVLLGVGVTGFITVFAFLTRNMAYAQPRFDHLRISTPFIRLMVSYRRVRGVRSVALLEAFPEQEMSWSDLQFLKPYAGETMVGVILSKYPMQMWILRLFFPKFMFYNRRTGFLLLVEDWMKFSTELDSRYGSWQQDRGGPRKRGGFTLEEYRKGQKKRWK